jgi:hypothetical protein
MKIRFSEDDFSKAQEMLTGMAADVARLQEPAEAGMKGKSPATEAFKGLAKTEIKFGDPTNDLIRLTPALFSAKKVQLDEIQKRQLHDRFDFYYLTLTISMKPGRGVQFRRLECSLEFKAPKAGGRPILQTIFPTSEWKDVLSFGGELKLGLTGNLDWQVGADLNSLPEAVKKALPGTISAGLANKNKMKSYIAIPKFEYKLGRANIAATGEGSAEAFWRIDKPELRQSYTALFGMVFKVPKGVTRISLHGTTAAEADIPYLVALVDDVFADMSKKWQALLMKQHSKRTRVEKLPIGDIKSWTLELPS